MAQPNGSPEHGRPCRLVNRAFTPARMEGVRTVSKEIATLLFHEPPGTGKVGLAKAVAHPRPVLVTCELFPLLVREGRP